MNKKFFQLTLLCLLVSLFTFGCGGKKGKWTPPKTLPPVSDDKAWEQLLSDALTQNCGKFPKGNKFLLAHDGEGDMDSYKGPIHYVTRGFQCDDEKDTQKLWIKFVQTDPKVLCKFYKATDKDSENLLKFYMEAADKACKEVNPTCRWHG